MGRAWDISVVISTYNRSDLLKGALESLLNQEANGINYEVIVVDNNSSDGTKEVVQSRLQGTENLKYVFEARQGVSYGRNTGIEYAQAPIIAFTDDDVRVTPNWISAIKRAFDEFPDADFVGGRILPHWRTEPPAWLTRAHWWPLALLDLGDESQRVDAGNPVCLPTANASFRREVFTELGGFSPHFSGREDHEMLLRIWLAGRHGVYAPDIIVMAEVQPERMTKSYHRKWNVTTGRFNSLMRLNELMGPDGKLVGDRSPATVFGIPAYMCKNLIVESFQWLMARQRRQESRMLQHENRICHMVGYVKTRFGLQTRQPRSRINEIIGAARRIVKNNV